MLTCAAGAYFSRKVGADTCTFYKAGAAMFCIPLFTKLFMHSLNMSVMDDSGEYTITSTRKIRMFSPQDRVGFFDLKQGSSEYIGRKLTAHEPKCTILSVIYFL